MRRLLRMSDPDPPADPEPPGERLVRCQTIFTDFSGLPENSYVNTFFFERPSDVEYANAIAPLGGLVAEFYNTALVTPFASPAIGTYLASYVNRAYTMKFSDMGQPSGFRPPTVLASTLPAAGAATNLPGEVALCVSFQGVNLLRVIPPRGRLYIGPLNTGISLQGSATVYPSADTAKTDAWRYIAKRLADNVRAIKSEPRYHWVVYSRQYDTWDNVRSGWVDNEWDIQRRRGKVATNRAGFTVPL
jgi:hypothetical protein